MSDSAVIINYIFKELKGSYPSWRQTFKSQEEVDNMKAVWIKRLFENNICTGEQVELGLRNCAKDKSDWFPSVGHFIDMCRPSAKELKIPALEAAFKTACTYASLRQCGEYPYCHPVTYAAAKAVGFHELRTKHERFTLKSFREAYEEATQEYIAGVDLVSKMPEQLQLQHKTQNQKLIKG